MSELQGPANLGRIGIWSLELRFGDPSAAEESVAELDALGYGAVWVPGGMDDKVLVDIDRLLDASSRTTIATGILNIWKYKPEEVAKWWAAQSIDRQQRIMLGLGVSHGPIIGEAWKKPLAATREFVRAACEAGLPPSSSCLAALGPKMLALAGETTAGAHPYLVTPEHTKQAREILGAGKLLAPEQGIILENDPGKARDIGRNALTHYRHLPNYQNSWRRMGFSETDIQEASDHLIDGLFAWGDVQQVASRVQAHLDAGADHVCLQVINPAEGGGFDFLKEAWRALAAELL